MKTRAMLFAVLGLVLTLSPLCCWCGMTEGRLREVNDEWYRVYSLDRKMTAEEASLFASLDENGKKKWGEDGKPTEGPLSNRKLEAAQDFKRAVDLEAQASE